MFDELSVWPIHLPPLEDEIASSWLMRNAIANGQHFWTFAYYSVGTHVVWNRDLDLRILDKYQEKLAYRLKQDKDTVFQTTLFSYAPNLYPGSGTNKQMKWVLPQGINKTVRHYGIQICPECLRTDEQPYYRKYWRLAFMVSCPKHGVWLHDQCPACAAPIMQKKIKPQANDFYTQDDMTKCHHCGFDLRHSFAAEADAKIVKLNQEQMRLLRYGHGKIGGTFHEVASEYFHSLHDRLNLGIKTYSKCEANCKVKDFSGVHNVKKVEFEFYPVVRRIEILIGFL